MKLVSFDEGSWQRNEKEGVFGATESGNRYDI